VQDSSADEAVRSWATKTIATIRERSPIGVAVTLRALRAGRHWNIAQAFRNEHAIASAFMAHSDFVTGVTARLIERSKERPNWAPNTLEDVRDADVDAFFVGCDAKSGGLPLLETGPRASYNEYPHAWTTLPTETAIKEQLQKSGGSQEEALKALLKNTDGKVGVKEKVEEVFSRL
jgi:3-hydroxyisobutyryl-CoA hydrolase